MRRLLYSRNNLYNILLLEKCWCILIIRTVLDKLFTQADGQTLLDAGINAGVVFPYGCKNGRCSTCKCKVLSGNTKVMLDELGLTAEEKAQGFILSCVRSATTDLLLDIQDLGDVAMPEIKTLPARINSLEKLTPDVLRVKLRLPPAAEFNYLSGQYIEVIGDGGVRRSYSIANAPSQDKQIELHIRSFKGGVMSDYWFNRAKNNDLVRINGPLGSFFTRSLSGLNLVFFATGTGIAPVKAMLEKLAATPISDRPMSVTVYWGCREPRDLYVDPSVWYPNLSYVPVLSRAPSGWAGAVGYIQNVFLNKSQLLDSTVIYACGSDAMIQNSKIKLIQAGLSENRFFSDAFVPSGNSYLIKEEL